MKGRFIFERGRDRGIYRLGIECSPFWISGFGERQYYVKLLIGSLTFLAMYATGERQGARIFFNDQEML